MLQFPARSFVDFYANHGMLQFKNRPWWKTVIGGSRLYVDRLIADGDFVTRLNADIKAVHRRPDRVVIETRDGVMHLYDQVVFAAHADQTLGLIADADRSEQALLSAFSYQKNVAVLHRSERWMPKRRQLWSGWNYIKGGGSDRRRTVASPTG